MVKMVNFVTYFNTQKKGCGGGFHLMFEELEKSY